jgi:hypothetical protein
MRPDTFGKVWGTVAGISLAIPPEKSKWIVASRMVNGAQRSAVQHRVQDDGCYVSSLVKHTDHFSQWGKLMS